MFGMKIIPGTLKTLTPLHHGGNEKTGSVTLLNRIKFMTDKGAVEVPIISGNSIRGVLRRLLFSDFLSLARYEINISRKSGQRLYHALFSGGMLETIEEKSRGTIDIALKKRIVEYLPPARLLGFSIGNQIIVSKLKVGQALPLCTELAGFLPDNVHPKSSVYDLLTTTFQTRRDELRIERKEGEQAVQMIVEHEDFAPGAMFYHEFRLEDPDEIDLSCLARALELWHDKPFIGGKSSIGYGQLKITYDLDETGKKYLEFVEERREEIRQVLNTLSSR